jgi:hypothetical protein
LKIELAGGSIFFVQFSHAMLIFTTRGSSLEDFSQILSTVFDKWLKFSKNVVSTNITNAF